MEQSIYISLILASFATYTCRALGVLFFNKISVESDLFNWIECISLGIIVSVISKIIIFPGGMLESTLLITRFLTIIILLFIFFISKKNVLLALFLATAFFTTIHNIELVSSYF